jgi:peroxiredoxin
MRTIINYGLNFLSATILTVTSISGQATTTILEGVAPTYAGDEFIFNSYSNMISFGETEVTRCTVDDSGHFSCTIPFDETHLVFINPGTYNCYFFAEPGRIYNLRFPAKRDLSQSEGTNPYEPARVHIVARPTGTTNPALANLSKEDLNFLIRAFNDAFYPHYFKYVINAATNNAGKSDVNKDIDQLTSPFDSTDNEFFKAYTEYRVALLKMFGIQENIKEIKKEYFSTRPILYNNPAYMELFNEVYNDYFQAVAEGDPKLDILTVINRKKSLADLSQILKKDELLSNPTLREFVILKGIYDAFYNEQFSRSALLILLDSISYTSGNARHIEYARNIKSQITNLLTGYEPPSFKLFDKDSNLVSLSDFSGKYIYLNFCNSYSYSCIKEFELLRALNSRHKEHLQLITVIMDGEPSALKELIDKNNYDWVFLHFGRQPEIRTDYDIKALPSYFLVGKDGRLILSPAPPPAENFEQLLFQVMRSRGDI